MLQTQVAVPDNTVEAKQTETLAFGEEKGLFQGQPNEENGWLMLRKPKLPVYLHGGVFKWQSLRWELQGVWLYSD